MNGDEGGGLGVAAVAFLTLTGLTFEHDAFLFEVALVEVLTTFLLETFSLGLLSVLLEGSLSLTLLEGSLALLCLAQLQSQK